jgi:hypothetical protein
MPALVSPSVSSRSRTDLRAGKFFFSFRYQAEFVDGGRPATQSEGLFVDRRAFDAQLHNWTRCGWRYFESAEDAAHNTTPEHVLAFPASEWSGRTEFVSTGPYRHNRAQYIREDRARELGAIYGIPAHEAGNYRPDF